MYLTFVASQLKELDEELGRGVEYEMLWREGDYEKARDFYAEHEQWPDRTHYQQALALIENGKIQKAQTVIARIKDTDLKASTQARVLFELQDWTRLAAIAPSSDETRKWQLLALAKQDLASAGQQMDEIKANVELELSQLRLLVKYYSITDNERMLAKYAKRLANSIDSETERLAKLTDKAIAGKSPQRAQRLLGKLVAVNPDAKGIQKYKRQIAELNANTEQQS